MDTNILFSIVTNKILISTIASIALSQIIKIITHFIVVRKVRWDRIFGDGGMPSSHSAAVCAAATMTGFTAGFDSTLFAIMAVFAIIVMHDSSGIRYHSGKQAKAINDMRDILEDKFNLPDSKDLKELLGHTRLQVLCGAILGIIVAIIINQIL